MLTGTVAAGARDLPRAEAAHAVPWYVWTAVLAVFSGVLGAHWDISWHRSIGRDTFWSAPHIAIYLKGVLAGLAFGYLILKTTFAERRRTDVVTIWGFKGPLGAFVGAWGGIAMLTSAPFDNWWHDAYGLDVKIVSPPHVLLIVGALAVTLGTLVLIQALRNRARDAGRDAGPLDTAFFLVAGLALVNMLVFQMEWISPILQHTAAMYRALAVTIPGMLCAFAIASGHRHACTIVALVYTMFLLALVWILPFFPAEPKLGPVYQQVTHFIPNGFPLLVVVPAVALDALLWRLRGRNRWLVAAAAGTSFLALFVAVQWPFASFLNSPASGNWFFGTHYRAYMQGPESYTARYLFVPLEPTAARFWRVMAMAFVFAPLSALGGLAFGRWLGRVAR